MIVKPFLSSFIYVWTLISFIQVNEVNDVTFAKDVVLVTAEGSIGVVSFDGNRFYCCICENNYCVHCALLKIKRQEKDDVPEFLDDFFKITSTFQASKNKESISWKSIPFDISDSRTLNPPNTYLPFIDGFYFYEDEDNTAVQRENQVSPKC